MASSVFQNLLAPKQKGANGTILVIGGSSVYTGAPLFVAEAALRSGSDLVYLMAPPEAVSSLKSLHEAIVMPLAQDQRILDKATACIIGPGLGRVVQKTLDLIVGIAKDLSNRGVPLVLDADAIHYYKQGLFSDISSCILTPNISENIGLSVYSGEHILVQKGPTDRITCGIDFLEVKTPGSSKRCGGQGDILSGVLGSALSVAKKDPMTACSDACSLVRTASHLAFSQKGYGLLTRDILEVLPTALKEAIGQAE